MVLKDAEAPRLLLGEEALLLHGIPVAAVSDLVAKTPNRVMLDIAGNMVSSPTLLVLMMSAVACVDWSYSAGAGERLPPLAGEGVDGAMHALNMIQNTSIGGRTEKEGGLHA